MIVGIGCDIVSHDLTKKLNWAQNPKIRLRIFSDDELNTYPTHLEQQVAFLAVRFAVKEAVLKCLGTGMVDGISLKEIEVLSDNHNRPNIVLSGEVHKMALEKGITSWHLSISHAESNSVAFVIAERL
jgi:holo-[acyl-carrier protein] synthase